MTSGRKQITSLAQVLLALLIVVVGTAILLRISTSPFVSPLPEVPISQVVQDVRTGKVLKILLEEESDIVVVQYVPRPGEGYFARAIKEEGAIATYLVENGVRADVLPEILVRRAITIRDYAGIMVFTVATGIVLLTVGFAVYFIRTRGSLHA
jgi:hypothetical protein